MFKYTIRHDSDVPIYKQLVDQINAEIRSGILKTGTQLPTVREMAERYNLSCGTVKRVYDRLQEMGDIEMTRRRGTFVKYLRQDQDSRKMQAMTAIDRMIRQLTELNFSPAEIHIFVSLKMREWGLKWSGIRIAVVTQYMDMASALNRQLSQIGNATVVTWSARQVRDYPYNLDEQSDVILVSKENAQWLENVLPDRSKIVCVAFALERASLMALAGSTGKICLFCSDGETPALMRAHLPAERPREITICMDAAGLEVALKDTDCLVLPDGMEDAPEAEALIRDFKARDRMIPLRYEIDEGSMLYLEERIARIREQRQLHPMGSHFWSEGDEMKQLSSLRRDIP